MVEPVTDQVYLQDVCSRLPLPICHLYMCNFPCLDDVYLMVPLNPPLEECCPLKAVSNIVSDRTHHNSRQPVITPPHNSIGECGDCISGRVVAVSGGGHIDGTMTGRGKHGFFTTCNGH